MLIHSQLSNYEQVQPWYTFPWWPRGGRLSFFKIFMNVFPATPRRDEALTWAGYRLGSQGQARNTQRNMMLLYGSNNKGTKTKTNRNPSVLFDFSTSPNNYLQCLRGRPAASPGKQLVDAKETRRVRQGMNRVVHDDGCLIGVSSAKVFRLSTTSCKKNFRVAPASTR